MRETTLLGENTKVYIDNENKLSATVVNNDSDSTFRSLARWVPSTTNRSLVKAGQNRVGMLSFKDAMIQAPLELAIGRDEELIFGT